MVNKHPLPGSERTVEQGSKVVGQCDPAERIEVFVMLRRQQQAQFDALMSKIEAGDPSVKPLSRETLAERLRRRARRHRQGQGLRHRTRPDGGARRSGRAHGRC